MRAMVLYDQADITRAPLRLEEVVDPRPGPGEVHVRTGSESCAR